MKQQYILGKYTHVVVREEDAIFGAGSKQFIINDKNFWEHLVLIAAQWIKKKTVDEVYNSLSLIILKKVLTVRLIFLFLTIFLSKLKHQTISSIIAIPEVISIIKAMVCIQPPFSISFCKKVLSF
ncbi:hypothetical protein [Bartonella grahamii]|uniref:Uncharacterized protein n=1 Tax=Bartonella grahamii TaxID=33045 RepID=A0A336NAL1_BARGR|nr:hypothetical protein [Bartonella grahamii]SSZ39336.1 Uncharacterised protein [Bartonella grahamii]